MAKQLLFYENVVPVTLQDHGKWSLERGKDYSYAAHINACPLMVSEFRAAAETLPIVFNRSAEGAMPAVVLGLLPEESMMVDKKGKWTGSYIPAFVRRYPFVFAQSEDGTKYTLCIDEGAPGIDKKGKKGERLFDDEGQPTDTMKGALEFTKSYEVEHRRTVLFGKLLAEHKLLDPMNAQITMPDGTKRAVTGFSAVSRERLKALPADVVKELFDNDALELIYIHLASMGKMEGLRNKAA